jgi:uncharacterized protein (DUF885 family)
MRLAALVLALAAAAAAPLRAATPFEERCAALAASDQDDAERLHALFALDWAYTLDEYPEAATAFGAPGRNDRWTDRSPEAIARRERELEAPARVLASIRPERLAPSGRLSYDLFRYDLDRALAGRRFPEDLLAVSQLGGIHQDAARTLAYAPARTVADYEAILARLRALPRAVDQTIALLARGIETGVTLPRVILGAVPAQVLAQIPDDPLASPLLAPFARFPPAFPRKTQDRLRRAAVDAFRDGVAPAFRRFHDFLAERYLPGARESVAWRDLPDGGAWYAHAVRGSTTTALTPARIHEIGLAEVKRIGRAMDEVAASAGFRGDLAGYRRHLEQNPQFYYTDREALLAGYRDLAKRADPALVKLFGRLPRLPYGVLAVPAHVEQSQPAAYYEPGSLAAGRPGYFYANSWDLPSRPRWAMEPLVLHEAVPGHHLQVSLAQELEDVPEFRRHADYTAFVEGWGLYAESLGPEMGFYTDPATRYGALTFEMWRAVRLVVDTGLHALGWPRERALAYFREETGKSAAESEVEVNRYLAWPGQALAYKIGELRFKDIRRKAEKALGDRFDIRAFHDALLAEGALPLDVLATRMDAWIAARQ